MEQWPTAALPIGAHAPWQAVAADDDLGNRQSSPLPTMRIVALSVFVALLFSCKAFALDGHADNDMQRVVILNAADPYLPAFLALDRAMREVIVARRGSSVSFHAEMLDMFRFEQNDLERDLVALLRKKYHGLRIDIVVAAGSNALDFALRHRDEVWPGATIVFHSVSDGLLQARGLDLPMVGVPVQLEFGPTIDLALRLQPATRTLAVVAGTADIDRERLSLLRSDLGRYAGQLDVQYLVGQSLDETLAQVRALPADASVLFLTMFRDGTGSLLVPRDVLTQIAAASPVPVFGIYETYLDRGIAAGSITSYTSQGRRAGELVNRVLDGEAAAAIGVLSPGSPSCIADARQLRHWGIDPRLLPPDCELRFVELTTWDRYHWQILAALAVMLAQGALIAALLRSRRRLHQSRNALHEEFTRRTQSESLASALHQRLARFGRERSLGAMATAIAHEVNQPLIAIQNYAQAARRRLEGAADDRPKVLELHAKIEAQAARAGAITQRVRALVGSSEVRLVPAPIVPLIEEVVRLVESEAAQLACRIVFAPVDGSPRVLADALQVQLVLVNLLRNAMQVLDGDHRADRTVSIDVRATDAHTVQVSVTDRGPGVPPERAADIFEPLSSSTSHGMGMGLAISRAIIDAHGGRIWVEPNPAGGAIFRFTLRRAEN